MTSDPAFDRSRFTTEPSAIRVDKPWGYELIFTPPEKPYTGKLLHVAAGNRLSLQYHDQKQETILLLHGAGVLLSENAHGVLEEIRMEQGQGYSILPGQRHRLVALEDCDFIEASTAEVGATYRLEDDSGRPTETEAERARERGGP